MRITFGRKPAPETHIQQLDKAKPGSLRTAKIHYEAGKGYMTRHRDGADAGNSPDSGEATDLATIMLREQYRTLTRLVPILYLVVIVATVALVFTTRGTVPALIGFLLPSPLILVIAFRLRYWLQARTHVDERDIRIIRKDISLTWKIGPILSFGFTLIGLLALRGGGNVQQPLIAVAIWIIAITSAFCLFSLPRAANLVILTSTVPLSLSFLFQDSELLIALAILLLIVSVLVMYMLRENFNTFSEIISSRAMIAEKHRLAQEATESATTMAYTDYLTSLPNRRHFELLLSSHMTARGHGNQQLAVGIVDLDGFKPVNDAHGHGAGDEVLRLVSARLKSVMNGHGHVARMGGDEFGIIGDGIGDPFEATALGHRIQSAFDEPFLIEGYPLHLTCTCGFALYPSSGDDPNRLIDRADMALYRGKSNERSGIAVFDAKDESLALENALLEQALRRAVADATIDVHFQPIVDLANGRPIGFEALARWHDPLLGNISPAVFIPMAERIGIIEPLGESLLRKAAHIAAQWPEHLMLSFNLSADDLFRPDAERRIIAIINECGLAPQRFEAEVTETAIMKNLANARRSLEGFRAAGVHVSLDDFGTGYSSLGHIRDLPLDKVKIDKSFVDRIGVDARTSNLLHSIVDMCALLELRCVAEGIEQVSQCDELKRMGCHSGQGYLFSRPLPAHAVEDYLTQHSG